jgi:O-antigen/teichoic acid export membrane protein
MAELTEDRVGEATGWRYAYLLAQAGLSLLLFVGLAAVLPANAFAVCAVALGSLVAVQAVADFGFSQAALAVLPNPGTVGPAMGRLVLESGIARLVLAGAGAALAGSCLLALAVPQSARLAIVAIAPASALAVVVAGVDGILRAHGRFRRPMLLVGASRLGGLPAIGVAAATSDAAATCAAVSAGIVLGTMPALYELRRHWIAADGRPAIRPLLRVAAPLGASNLCILASARINTIVLGSAASVASAAVFESAWRVFQVGQYALGAAATAIAPFVAAGLSDPKVRGPLLHRRLRRTVLTMTLGGGALGAAIVVLRHPIADVVSGGGADAVARSLVLLGPALPVSLLLLFTTIMLSASSVRDRYWVLGAYATGAGVNLLTVLMLAASSADVAGAAASALGMCATLAVLVPRLREALRAIRSG